MSCSAPPMGGARDGIADEVDAARPATEGDADATRASSDALPSYVTLCLGIYLAGVASSGEGLVEESDQEFR